MLHLFIDTELFLTVWKIGHLLCITELPKKYYSMESG